jgi:hypothetical protein
MDLILTNLAPNRTASIQLYERGTDTAVGSPIVGSGLLYAYTFADLPLGDFDYVLFGFTDPPGDRRAVRVTATQVIDADSWYWIESIDWQSTGLVQNRLSVDYESDWQCIDGVEECGYIFSTQRTTDLTAPTEGVAVKRTAPNKSDFISATVEILSTDLVFTIWQATLVDGTTLIEVQPDDALDCDDAKWIIKSAKNLVDSAQWRCICFRSQTKVVA